MVDLRTCYMSSVNMYLRWTTQHWSSHFVKIQRLVLYTYSFSFMEWMRYIMYVAILSDCCNKSLYNVSRNRSNENDRNYLSACQVPEPPAMHVKCQYCQLSMQLYGYQSFDGFNEKLHYHYQRSANLFRLPLRPKNTFVSCCHLSFLL